MNNTNGKIAETSKKKMMEALLTLMETFSYQEITITQITQEAHLARRTFYRLFSSKDEVLSEYLRQLFQESATGYIKNGKKDYWDAAPQFFSFWKQHSHFLLLLKKNHMLYFLLEYQNEYYKLLLLSKDESHPVILDNPYLSYMTAYSMGGLLNTLFCWVEYDMKDDPEKFFTYIQSVYK